MKRSRAFLQLSPPDPRLLIEIVMRLAVITLTSRIHPWSTLQRLLCQSANRHPRFGLTLYSSAQRIGSAIEVARRNGSKATYPLRALTAQLSLSQSGYSADWQIGIATCEDKKSKAPVWLTSGSGINIGDRSDLDRFLPLSPPAKEKA